MAGGGGPIYKLSDNTSVNSSSHAGVLGICITIKNASDGKNCQARVFSAGLQMT